MCQINNVLRNTWDKPLICYKVLLRDLESIRSPYFSDCLWKLKETKCLKQLSFRENWIGSGFFHAFISKADACYEKNKMEKLYPLNEYIITKMEVPPYTYYYTGMTEDGINSIATPVITFKQIL